MEVEYATRPSKSSTDQAPGSGPSENTHADSDTAPDNLADPASSGANSSKELSPQEANDNPTATDHPYVDNANVNASLLDASENVTPEVLDRSPSTPNHNGSPAGLALPSAQSLASSVPHNRLTPRKLTPVSPAATPKPLKVDKEVARLKEVIDEASPEALHKLLRQEWRVFLYTPIEEDHLSYILRACLKNSTPIVAERGLKEILAQPHLGPVALRQVLEDADATQVFRALPSEQRNRMVDLVLEMTGSHQTIDRIPASVKDKIVAQYIRETPAKILVNWLAKAGRLGYSTDDIIDSDDELVSPPDPPTKSGRSDEDLRSIPHDLHEAPHQIRQASTYYPASRDHIQNRAGPPPGAVTAAPPSRRDAFEPCSLCGFSSPTRGGQAYHSLKKPCQHLPPVPPASGWWARCPNCDVLFVTKQGQNYHNLNKVCSTGKYAGDASKPDPIRPPVHTPNSIPTQPHTAAQIPRPPLHTPTPILPPPRKAQPAQFLYRPESVQEIIRAIDPNARVNPDQLSPAKRAEMDSKIEMEDQRYQNALAALDTDQSLSYLTKEEKEQRKVSLKNSNATKKSQIRKKYGVSLRLRENDKAALRSAPLSSPAPVSRASKAAPPYSSPHAPYIPSHVSTSSSFSPINVPSPPTNTNSTRFGRPPMRTVPSYSQPHNTNVSQNESSSGFGILKIQSAGGHRNKRQRTSSFGTEQAVSGSGSTKVANWIPPPLSRPQIPHSPDASVSVSGTESSITEVRSEDAASKYPKKVPVAAAQAKWEQLQSQKNGAGNVRSVETPIGSNRPRANSNAVQEPINIDPSDSDEHEPLENNANAKVPLSYAERFAEHEHMLIHNPDKPVPTIEDTKSETQGRPAPFVSATRGKYTAKRGGRHAR